MSIHPTLIETMRVEHAQIALLDAHLERLARSAQQLNYTFCHNTVCEHITEYLSLLTSGVWRLRLTLDNEGQPVLEHSALEPDVQPVSILLADTPLPESPWLSIKSSHRPWYQAANQTLRMQPQLFDVIFCNQAGEVCEGSRSNIYLQRDGQWFTPPVSCGLLPGVMRSQLLKSGQAHEAVLYPSDLKNADAIRVSNALRGWLDANIQA
ncbi:aminotransferase class IV [Paenalcaligenes suwonensis]|uniref:aminotransferase class IV n=1 Tax=Paenalcaligenes suwonensis TaxID=1202713 RepID=UPI00140D7288|nr:aminotransferase class IV [Paenalcaligenes suwonensis]NHC60635.1 aminotransferase [Paenalcaligenes suwonensis]